MEESPELKEAKREEYVARGDYRIASQQTDEHAKQVDEMAKDPNCPRQMYEDALETQRVLEMNEIEARNRWEKAQTKLLEEQKLEEKKNALRKDMNLDNEEEKENEKENEKKNEKKNGNEHGKSL